MRIAVKSFAFGALIQVLAMSFVIGCFGVSEEVRATSYAISKDVPIFVKHSVSAVATATVTIGDTTVGRKDLERRMRRSASALAAKEASESAINEASTALLRDLPPYADASRPASGTNTTDWEKLAELLERNLSALAEQTK